MRPSWCEVVADWSWAKSWPRPASKRRKPLAMVRSCAELRRRTSCFRFELEKNRQAAYAACEARLAELGTPNVLVDVEHLFDGRTLLFYFLGELTPEVEALTDELAELYEAHAQFRSFSQAVTEGCGPHCGTEAATGHGCTSCATGCAIAGHCATRST